MCIFGISKVVCFVVFYLAVLKEEVDIISDPLSLHNDPCFYPSRPIQGTLQCSRAVSIGTWAVTEDLVKPLLKIKCKFLCDEF